MLGQEIQHPGAALAWGRALQPATGWGARRAVRPGAVAALVACLMAAPVQAASSPGPCVAAGPPAPGATDAENWLERQIRRFRGYPHMDRAYRLMQQGRLQEAATEVAAYLNDEPNDTAARQTYLILLYEQGRYVETACEATALLRRYPPSGPTLMYRALAQLRLGITREGLSDLRAAIAAEETPRDRRLFAAAAGIDLLIGQGSFAEAQTLLDDVKENADDFGFHYRQGIVAEALGHDDGAALAYEAASHKAATDTERVKALLAAGYLASRRNRWPHAYELLSAARAAAPRDPAVLRALADAARHLDRNDEAAQLTEAVLAIAPAQRDNESLADLSVKRKDWSRAAEQYLALLDQSATGTQKYQWNMQLAWCYQQLGRTADAQAAVRRALKIKPTPEALRTLAVQLDAAGKTAEAAALLASSPALGAGVVPHSQLAVLYEKLGKPQAAIAQLRAALRTDNAAELHARLGYLYAATGAYTDAARELEQAGSGKEQGAQRVRIAELYGKSGDHARELEELEHASAGPLEPEERRYVERQRGFLYTQLGDREHAVTAWQSAVGAGADDAGIHMDLGFALADLKRWDEARDEFLQAHDREPAPLALYYAGRCYRQLGQPGPAARYLEIAARDAGQLEAAVRKSLYDELGFAYRTDAREQDASTVWHQSLEVQQDPAIALELAFTELHLGHPEAAEQLLASVPEADLPTVQRVSRAEAIAQIKQQQGQLTLARAALAQAQALQSSAERAYRMGLLAQQATDYTTAISDYNQAVTREPDNSQYAKSLIYAYRKAGDTRQAEALLQDFIARHPGEIAAYHELAYTQVAQGQQSAATKTLRQGIDADLAAADPSGSGHDSGELEAMREEYESLARRFEATVYESYRPQGGPAIGDALTEGIVPSQGGAELWYFPTGALGRTDSPLQLGARVVWANTPTSIGIDTRSMLGSLSVRFKPFQTADFFVGVERLFKIGSLSEDDWLLRTSFGLGSEVAPRPGKSIWGYSQFYAEGGYFVKSHTEATYLEGREGFTLPLTSHVLLTPHLVLAYRQQNPDPQGLTLTEGGPGVSLKFFFSGGRYSSYGSSFDLLTQYRERLSGPGHSDWVLTGILHF